jgi:histidine triad (HIT) family protein
VIAENENVLAILDIYPATPGHTLVLPKQHYENIYVLSNEIASCLMEITLMAAVAIRSQLNPQGLNLVQANGRAAGQTVNHFHIHLVPRFKDDKVILEYGHLPVRAGAEELASMAARIKQGLLPNT